MNQPVTYDEIRRQPAAWETTINSLGGERERLLSFFRDTAPREVIFTGCGTSYYLSIAAASFFQEQTGILSRAIPASDVMLHPRSVITESPALVIGLSRSGNTTELVRALREVRKRGLARCLAVTSNPSGRSVQAAEQFIILPHIREQSVVMTGSFTNMLFALQLFAAWVSRDETLLGELRQLPRLGEAGILEADELARTLGGDLRFNHMIYLGLGAYFGLASEGMLKMKEMTQVFSEAFNPLEFRHGPISVIRGGCRVFLLSRRSTRPYDRDLAEDLRRHGADVVVLGEGLDGFSADHKLDLAPGLSDGSRALLYMPFLQLTAYHRTLKMGLDPDRPRNLNPVVVLDDDKGE
ncbi:glucosamine--fructose-6-phosphate aminotransferase (isomerizing) [Melghirimyces profundicolus]|uniref:Glucosamine--fructose-6-phosphate aminotransferase (Isomerizing) n=1 Tax=Melghirimyces profundicolus TaxID=1242148 RepID=A0A2T6BD33_9BACL|nr:SIS domain-containing protein [Melghirimyces profundicolus]PTX53988.1 glucosamine--fructose-6-phosphate aminotransferase (isomerizing) [Melghirimyces profundicolus]